MAGADARCGWMKQVSSGYESLPDCGRRNRSRRQHKGGYAV